MTLAVNAKRVMIAGVCMMRAVQAKECPFSKRSFPKLAEYDQKRESTFLFYDSREKNPNARLHSTGH